MESFSFLPFQFLIELEYSGMGRNKEQSARMLDHLVVHAPRLLEPYMEPVLKVLVPKLKELDLNPGVVVSILRCIGDLAEVSWHIIYCSLWHQL